MADYKTHTYPKHTVYCSCQDPFHSEMVHIGEHGTYQCKMCGHEVQFWRSRGWCNDHPDQEDQNMKQDGMEYTCKICGKTVVHHLQVITAISFSWSSDMGKDQVQLYPLNDAESNRTTSPSPSNKENEATYRRKEQKQEKALKGNRQAKKDEQHETRGDKQ